ncbi:MAG TPA: hypothetical protein DCO83_05615 [Mucilaginibacter sp.]|nr:hypothetical protein [Mucilaginibacter sp.]
MVEICFFNPRYFNPVKRQQKLDRIAKKEYRAIGVYIIDNEQKRIDALKATDLNDIWGIGGRITAKLNARGIFTAYDLSLIDTNWVKANFSVVVQRAVYELTGDQLYPIGINNPR